MSDHDETGKDRLDELEAMIRDQDQEAAINEKAADLVIRVLRLWNVDLRERMTSFYELDDDRLVAMVDGGSVMFEIVGDDVHVVGPLDDTGKVACYVVEPDGHYYLAASADDPYSARQAGLN